MSLFENDQYQWRETYFVLFEERHRPTTEQLVAALGKLGDAYQITNVQTGDDGRFESLSLFSPLDNAAMDIICTEGDEVAEQVKELTQEFRTATLTDEERSKVRRLSACTARFDVFHFEHISSFAPDDEDDEYLDPGSLLLVLGRLTELCQGVSIDPQTGSVL